MNEGPGERGSSGVAERLEQAVHVCRFERGVMQLVRCGFVGSGVPLGRPHAAICRTAMSNTMR